MKSKDTQTVKPNQNVEKQLKKKRTQTQRQPFGIAHVQTYHDTDTQSCQTPHTQYSTVSCMTVPPFNVDSEMVTDSCTQESRHIQTYSYLKNKGTQYKVQNNVSRCSSKTPDTPKKMPTSRVEPSPQTTTEPEDPPSDPPLDPSLVESNLNLLKKLDSLILLYDREETLNLRTTCATYKT